MNLLYICLHVLKSENQLTYNMDLDEPYFFVLNNQKNFLMFNFSSFSNEKVVYFCLKAFIVILFERWLQLLLNILNCLVFGENIKGQRSFL